MSKQEVASYCFHHKGSKVGRNKKKYLVELSAFVPWR